MTGNERGGKDCGLAFKGFVFISWAGYTYVRCFCRFFLGLAFHLITRVLVWGFTGVRGIKISAAGPIAFLSLEYIPYILHMSHYTIVLFSWGRIGTLLYRSSVLERSFPSFLDKYWWYECTYSLAYLTFSQKLNGHGPSWHLTHKY